MPNNLLRQPNFAIAGALVWLVVALALLLQHWPQTAETLLDTDDAMRLVQLRDLARTARALGLVRPASVADSAAVRRRHALVAADRCRARRSALVFRMFVEPPDAERLMRAWWPLLWLMPTIAGMAAIAWRIAGREAAMVALLLAMVGVPAYQQFTPGRIDHHNVRSR